jgi:hypothetical protein
MNTDMVITDNTIIIIMITEDSDRFLGGLDLNLEVVTITNLTTTENIIMEGHPILGLVDSDQTLEDLPIQGQALDHSIRDRALVLRIQDRALDLRIQDRVLVLPIRGRALDLPIRGRVLALPIQDRALVHPIRGHLSLCLIRRLYQQQSRIQILSMCFNE